MSRRHSPAWLAVRATRAARRAADPTVQARRVAHEKRAAREAAKKREAAA